MDLKDCSTEELKAELKRRSGLAKAEKAKVKRCRMCKHCGEITYFGSPNNGFVFGLNRCCRYQKRKSRKYYRALSGHHLACEHYEEKEIKL